MKADRLIGRPRRLSVLFILLLAGTGCANGAGPPGSTIDALLFDVQGHRGATGLRPESTLASFETALDIGVHTLELDVHLTADERLLIWHDPAIWPSKCGARPGADPGLDPDTVADPATDLQIVDLSASQLDGFVCDRNPNFDAYPEQSRAPTMLADDAFGLVTLPHLFAFVAEYATSEDKSDPQRARAESIRFNIETKGRDLVADGRMEALLVAAIAQAELGQRVSIQSVDPESLRAVRALDSDIRLALLTTRDVPDFSVLIDDDVAVWSPRHRDVTESAVNEAQAVGLQVIPWTVNDAERMRELIDLGVDGLITDRPDVAIEIADPGR